MTQTTTEVLCFGGHQVPITTVVRRSSLPGLGFVAKSGVHLDAGDEHGATIMGFSCGPNVARAAAISRWEVVERAFATWALVADQCDDDGTVPGYRWPDLAAHVRVPAHEATLGGPDPEVAWDSTGLACGPSVEAAALHAICERVERFVVARVWYADYGLLPLGRPCLLEGGGVLHRYVWAERPTIGFVMTVITDRPPGSLICGTAIRPSLERAAAKSDEEALMLLDSHLEGDDGHCDSDAMRAQLTSLFEPEVAAARRRHLCSRIRGDGLGDPAVVSLRSLLEGLDAVTREHEPTIAILRQCGEGAVVRAQCSGMECLATLAERDGGATVPHPIC